MDFLKDKPTIASARSCLIRIHFASNALRCSGKQEDEISPAYVNVRVFLCSYMIAYKPSYIFDSIQTLEKALIEAAKLMLSSFDTIIRFTLQKGSLQSIDNAYLANFSLLLYDYLRCFKAWKIPDEAKLLKRIKSALTALYQAEALLPADEPADSKISTEFRVQIERLRGKMMSIGGPAVLAEFDSTRPAIVAGIERGRDRVAWPEKTSNEQLAHELLLDPTFQLGDDGEYDGFDASSKGIRDRFHGVSFIAVLWCVEVSYCLSSPAILGLHRG